MNFSIPIFFSQPVIECTPFSFFSYNLLFISVLFICSLKKGRKTCIIKIELFQKKMEHNQINLYMYAYYKNGEQSLINFRLRLNHKNSIFFSFAIFFTLKRAFINLFQAIF